MSRAAPDIIELESGAEGNPPVSHIAEVEITPEMIAAGLAAVWPAELSDWEDRGAVLNRVFSAMASVASPAVG